MTSTTIRPAFSKWPDYNRRFIDAISGLSDEQLAIQPTSDAWPVWGTIGHLACQRVFWICDFAGEPGAETTRFTDAGHNCPGDDDLDHPLAVAALVEALESTFRIIDRCLDRWTLPMLDEELRRPEWGADWVHTRGSVLQRVFSHDAWHAADVSATLGRAGLRQVDLWD